MDLCVPCSHLGVEDAVATVVAHTLDTDADIGAALDAAGFASSQRAKAWGVEQRSRRPLESPLLLPPSAERSRSGNICQLPS